MADIIILFYLIFTKEVFILHDPLIAPSILACDFSILGKQVKDVEKAGCKMLHLDIMDGHFVPNISFGPQIVASLRPNSDMIFDVHLMITHPTHYIDAFVKAGADSITFHLECNEDTTKVINKIRSSGCMVGLSMKPGTSIKSVMPYLNLIDMLLVMSVEPGYGGQKFIPDSIEKIKEIRKAAPHLDIQVDGGINEQTSKLVLDAGANILVAGTSVFGSDNYAVAMSKLLGGN